MRGFAPIIMKRLPFPSVVLASRNDERVAFERAEAFASAWGSRLIDVGALGHIGSSAKLGLWPQGLVLFGQFIASVGCGIHESAGHCVPIFIPVRCRPTRRSSGPPKSCPFCRPLLGNATGRFGSGPGFR